MAHLYSPTRSNDRLAMCQHPNNAGGLILRILATCLSRWVPSCNVISRELFTLLKGIVSPCFKNARMCDFVRCRTYHAMTYNGRSLRPCQRSGPNSVRELLVLSKIIPNSQARAWICHDRLPASDLSLAPQTPICQICCTPPLTRQASIHRPSIKVSPTGDELYIT